MHWKWNLVYPIRFDASDFIMFAMQILRCHSKLKSTKQWSDDWQRCTRIASLFAWTTNKSLRFRWLSFCMFSCFLAAIFFIISLMRVYLLQTFLQKKRTRNSRTAKFHRFCSRRHFFLCHKRVFQFISCFYKQQNLQDAQQKMLFKKNMFLGYFCASERLLKTVSFPRNRACVWKVALASGKEKILLLLLVWCLHTSSFQGKEL